MQMTERPLLSISILVSNRLDTIGKCMESIYPLLTQIPCELIALDTVGEGTDGSIEVVRKYTDKVYRFEWCNDFAKARNYGLERCSGEWFMFMDDDEWFEDVSEIIEFFTSGEYKHYNCASYKIHDYTNRKGDYRVASLFRMTKHTKETRFVGTVHEYLEPMEVPMKEFSSYIHHYGYVFDTEEAHRKHCERNLRLLRPEFEKKPWNMHMRAQLVQEYMFLPEFWEEGEKLCEDTFRAERKNYIKAEFQWILSAYVRLAAKNGNLEKMAERAQMLREKFPLNAMADVAISTMELDARCKLKQYEAGIKLYERIVDRRNYLVEHPEEKQYMVCLDFENFLENTMYCDTLKSAISCYRNLGKEEQARKLVKERLERLTAPILTVSILVSNRKETIRKCMESIRQLLATVPSELIVVDTVGEEHSDGSLAIAKEYTKHIVPFEWKDDFSAARNVGLREAKGEWFLYLDDDEWFEDTKEIQEFFLSGEYIAYNSATYVVRNYKDIEGKEYKDTVVGRMVRRGRSTSFTGCINETFANMYLPNKAFSNYVHHYGFVYKTESERKEHMDYVCRLLQKGLTEYPSNPKEGRQENNQYQFRITTLFGLYESLQKPVEEAEKQYKELKEQKLMISVVEQVVCYHITRLLILHQQYAKAYYYAKRYFELDTEMGEVPSEFEKYRLPEFREEMLNLGGFCAWQAKEYEDAWECYASMSWETMGAEAEDTLWKVFALAEERVQADELYRIIKRVMSNEALKPVMGKLMKNPRVKERISQTLSEQKGKSEAKMPKIEELPLEEFKEEIKKLYFSEDTQRQAINWDELLSCLQQRDGIKYSFLLGFIAEQEAVKLTAAGKEVAEFMEYSTLAFRQHYEALFRETCFTTVGMEWMPPEMQYNDILFRFLQEGKKNLRLLLSAAKLRPEMAQVMKAWLGELTVK